MKDTAYASLFDKKDLPSLYKLAEKVRATHDQTLVNDFNLKCQKKWDDHNPIIGDNIEFLQVSKSDDLVVNAGINLCIDQILGVSVVRWLWMVTSVSAAVVTTADTTIPSATTPVNMSLSGWREYSGSSLRFAGIFGESVGTLNILSAGIMTGPASGTLLNRSVFSNFPINHVANVTGFVISTIIEFVPVI